MSAKSKLVKKIGRGKYRYEFSTPETYVFKPEKGLTKEIINTISRMKGEPPWMQEFRLAAYQTFLAKKLPNWGPNLSRIDFDNIYYYIKPTEQQEQSWDAVPKNIKKTFDRLGIPQAEKEYLSGVKAQYESEVVYGSLLKELSEQGVIFLDTD
ncbi:Fe-S cluster assembly protein SufB, partial [Patescibacteria group bacterium]|nr:Fe-S cluster assembly protein SufB [Patescibacteria group bacterium]